MGDPNLVTTCNFHGQEFLFKMNIVCNNLEILVTDKSSGEEWQCSYDATFKCLKTDGISIFNDKRFILKVSVLAKSYIGINLENVELELDIENLTHKTGNFKQFEIFVAMIKSGLLRTSESVTLDLLTFEDLELLRSRKITKSVGPNNNNRRYLIVTYVVEFDKIRYPLPLEYCGPPDPIVLQATIRRLEVELAKTKEELTLKLNNSDAKKIYFLQKRNDELTEENLELQEEVRRLARQTGKKPKTQVLSLQKAVSTLEKCVVNERNSHHELVEKLKNDKVQLAKELAKVKYSERNLKTKLNKVSGSSKMGLGDHLKLSPTSKLSSSSIKTMYKRRESPVVDYEMERARSRTSAGTFKTNNVFDQPRKSKSTTKCARSRDSSSSSTKYGDPECLDLTETPPYRTKSLLKSRCSSPESRASSRCSSRSSTRGDKKNMDYKNLEEKIANLQRLLKNNGICDKEK